MVNLDWSTMFFPDVPILEMVIRGTLVYLSIFVLLRVVLKREAGTISVTDLLVVTLLADAAQNAMASQYRSITDGLVLVATILFWAFAVDWLAFHYPKFESLIKPPPLLLIQNGHLIYRNMRKEYLTEEEIMTMIRLQGIEDIGRIKKAYMESNGRISVVTGERSANADDQQSPYS